MEYKYKLMMFGFGIRLKDMYEVKIRLSQIPIHRAKIEGLEQCYLIDLSNARKFDIAYDDKGFFVVGM